MIDRLLMAASEPCPFGCLYCFAARDDYRAPEYDVPSVVRSHETTIIYPACDGEFFLLPDFQSRLVQLEKGITVDTVVSISTKAPVQHERLQALVAFDRRLRATNRGFVKVAVSFSNATLCAEIEPGAASFRERVRTLETFATHGLTSGVTIKPLLPFVEISEYFDIVRACAPYASAFLLGDLYVADDQFFRDVIAGRYPTTERRISWLAEHPVWAVVESLRLKADVHKFIREQGLLSFDSDLELIAEIQESLVRV